MIFGGNDTEDFEYLSGPQPCGSGIKVVCFAFIPIGWLEFHTGGIWR